MKPLKPHLTRARIALKKANPKQRDRIRHRVKVLEVVKLLRGRA